MLRPLSGILTDSKVVEHQSPAKRDLTPTLVCPGVKSDEFEIGRIPDGFLKRPISRLAHSKECGAAPFWDFQDGLAGLYP
jgi:hypothetical protein